MDIKINKAIRARRRFKAVVRTVIQNLPWLRTDTSSDTGGVKKLFKKKTKSLLTTDHKSILNKPADLRTPEENQIIHRQIGGFKFFRKYPENVKLMLSSHSYFKYYEEGRVILRQNHPAYALYFILSGEVEMTELAFDKVANEYVENLVTTLGPGTAFGEGSLISDEPRQHTVKTIVPSEFLYLSRDDFNTILRDSLRKKWDYILSSLNRFSYFDQWSATTRTDCCMLAKIKNFEKGQTILGDGFGQKGFAHFVLKGKCQVIEHLSVVSKYINGKKYYKQYVRDKRSFANLGAGRKSQATSQKSKALHASERKSDATRTSKANDDDEEDEDDDEDEFLLPRDVETYFIQVCLFLELACFSIGESMERRRIIAATDVEILIIPKYWMLQKGKGNIWLRIQQYLQKHIPSSKEVFKEFLEQRKWREYRNDLVMSSVHRIPCNVPQNVPYSVRIFDDFKYDELQRKKEYPHLQKNH